MISRGSLALAIALCLAISTVAADDEEQINTYGRDFAIREGEPFSVHCNVTNFEALKWQKDGVDIVDKAENNITLLEKSQPWGKQAELRVSFATVGHTGNYRCNSFHGRGQLVYVIGANSIKTNKDFSDYKVFEPRKPLKLECNVTDENPDITWVRTLKDKEEKITSNFDKERFTVSSNSLIITKFTNEDAEYNYTCKLSKRSNSGQTIEVTETFVVIVPPIAWIVKNHDMVENEQMLLNCSVSGHPTPDVVWKFGNNTYESSTDRITLQSHGNVKNAILIIENVTIEDRGTYTCHASTLGGAKDSSASTIVRVKDKLAALWPFLGICAEVIVLCIIILIYEKRRNKTELDESDTDQSPEQKNTPDVGKDVRHRK